MIDNFGKALVPELSYFTLFAPMVLVLALKPTGLYGRGVARRARGGRRSSSLLAAFLLVGPPFLSAYWVGLLTQMRHPRRSLR